MSIGRDTFWTPAHLLIQAGGIIGGGAGATLILSAPFDNWWHNAYGLDVKILSPPHVVLTLGILGVAAGGVLQIVATLNRAPPADRRWFELALVLIGGEVVTLGMTSILELTFRSNLHRAEPYRAMALVAPIQLFAFARAAYRRYAASIIAAIYTAFMIGMIWLFPLFPAEAKLGPVYQPITHYIPLEFPLLIVVPALVCDAVLARL